MRVFVVGTGRCGTTTFAAACKHMTNYTASHETHSPRGIYPDWHVEVNAALHYSVALLSARYPDSFWVHLVRERAACMASLAAFQNGGFLRAYKSLYPSVVGTTLGEAAAHYYDSTVNVVRAQLAAALHMEMRLEAIQEQWSCFWDCIKAEGNYQASLETWKVKYNSTEQLRRQRR